MLLFGSVYSKNINWTLLLNSRIKRIICTYIFGTNNFFLWLVVLKEVCQRTVKKMHVCIFTKLLIIYAKNVSVLLDVEYSDNFVWNEPISFGFTLLESFPLWYVFDFLPPTDVLRVHVCASVARKHYIGYYLTIHIECAVGRRRITRQSCLRSARFPRKACIFFFIRTYDNRSNALYLGIESIF